MSHMHHINEFDNFRNDSVAKVVRDLQNLGKELNLTPSEEHELSTLIEEYRTARIEEERLKNISTGFRFQLNDKEIPGDFILSHKDKEYVKDLYSEWRSGNKEAYHNHINEEAAQYDKTEALQHDIEDFFNKHKGNDDYISQMERAMERQDDESFWATMAQEAEDPEIQDFCLDIHEINESVENSKAYARSADKEFKETEAQADKAIEQAEEIIYAKEDKLADIQDSLLNPESTKETSFADKMVKDILKDMNVPSSLNTKDNKDLAREAVTAAHRSVAEHPLRYTMQGIIHQLRQTKAEINESRRYMVETEGGYNNALVQAKSAVLAKVNPVVEPIKGVVMTTARETVTTFGSITSAAYEKFAELAEKGCNILKKGYKALVKGAACVLEVCTFGAYSVLNDKLCDKFVELDSKYNPNGKNSLLVSIAHRAHVTKDSYANDIHNLVWGEGNTSPFQDVAGFTKNSISFVTSIPEKISEKAGEMADKVGRKAESVANKIEKAGDKVIYKAYTTKEDITSALNKALDKVQETAENIAHSINVQLVQLKADRLGIQAFIADKQAAFCEKYERRLATKIEKIEKADRAIDDTLANIKKEMEALKGAITAYKREPYTPSKNVMEMLAILKNEVPTNQITTYIRNLEKAIARDKELYEQEGAKELALLYLKYNDKCAEYEEAVEKANEVKAKHQDKMDKALEKLDKTAEMRENLENKSKEKTTEAIDMVMNARNKTKDSKENDSQDFDRDDME